MKIVKQNLESFLDACMPEPNSGCFIWLKSLMKNGYGRSSLIHNNKIHRLAHRVSWILHYGVIPEDKMVLHKCDNRLCVNPTHLFLGTAKDNTHDMLDKFRMAYGIKHGQARHNTEDILKIRQLAKNGISQKNIAHKFKLSQSAISLIVNKKNRKFE